MALTLTFAEEEQGSPAPSAIVIEMDTTQDAVHFTEIDENGWNDPAQIQRQSNPDLFA